MKSKIKQEKGITLIALVVTIIVLLILAGISISALAGQNGLLNRAVESKEATGITQTEEAIKVAVMDAATQGLGTITDANLKTALNNNVGAGKYEITGDETNGWTVTVDGKDVTKLKGKELIKYRREDIGFVFQFYNLVQNLTAKENVELATQICKNSLDTEMVIEKVGLGNRKNNFPSQLSGGEQQRVAIARAIVNNPKLLICDEPTGNLDPDMSMEIVKLLDSINKATGTTIIMATHDREIVNKMKKRVLVLKEGRLVKDYEKGKYDDEAI